MPTKLDVDFFAISFNELYQYKGEYGDLKLKSFEGSPLKTNFPSQMIGLFWDPVLPSSWWLPTEVYVLPRKQLNWLYQKLEYK